jgi:hypothetical protein
LLVDAGADIHARISDACIVDSFWTCYGGFTPLHGLIHDARFPHTNDELESLVYLINRGASVFTVDSNRRSVSATAYTKTIYDKKRNASFRHIGGYRGDLWDATLAICGYDLLEFRKDYPRSPRYRIDYERSDFERLWKGIEHLCPYWDDRRWPEVGGDGDYWTDSDELDSDITGSDADSDSSGGCELQSLGNRDADEPWLGKVTELSDREEAG